MRVAAPAQVYMLKQSSGAAISRRAEQTLEKPFPTVTRAGHKSRRLGVVSARSVHVHRKRVDKSGVKKRPARAQTRLTACNNTTHMDISITCPYICLQRCEFNILIIYFFVLKNDEASEIFT